MTTYQRNKLTLFIHKFLPLMLEGKSQISVEFYGFAWFVKVELLYEVFFYLIRFLNTEQLCGFVSKTSHCFN